MEHTSEDAAFQLPHSCAAAHKSSESTYSNLLPVKLTSPFDTGLKSSRGNCRQSASRQTLKSWSRKSASKYRTSLASTSTSTRSSPSFGKACKSGTSKSNRYLEPCRLEHCNFSNQFCAVDRWQSQRRRTLRKLHGWCSFWESKRSSWAAKTLPS